MADNDQIQGTEEAQEAQSQLTEKAQTLGERSRTVDSRLDAFFQGQTPAADAKPPEPMPSSDKATGTTGETPSGSVATETPTDKPQDEPTLPDNASDRTREQFEKLREENRRLKEEKRKTTSQINSVFDEFHPDYNLPPQVAMQPAAPTPFLNQQQVAAIQNQFVMPDGTVDIDGLNRSLMQANQMAQQAAAQNQQLKQRIERFEETQEVREAHSKYPELDPQAEKFDQQFFDMVKDRLLRERFYNGKDLTLLQAAEDIRKAYQPASASPEKLKEEAVAEYKEAQAARNQGPLSDGKGEARQEASIDQLRNQTRKGGLENKALDERLKRYFGS